MMNVEAEILQLLATYGPFAGQAAAQSLGSSAISGIKLLLQKITQKFHQKGEVAESAIKDFEATPNDADTQALVLQLLRKFSREDPTFSQEITNLLQEVKNDPAAAQFTLLISGNANVGMAGQNYGQVTINQTTYQQAQRRVLSPVPPHIQLQALEQILGMFESRGFITQEELADYLATPAARDNVHPIYASLPLPSVTEGLQQLIQSGRIKLLGNGKIEIVKKSS